LDKALEYLGGVTEHEAGKELSLPGDLRVLLVFIFVVSSEKDLN
jgi:hypothetical protein